MQDKGYLLVNVQLPDAASLERTEQVMRRIDDIARQRCRASSTPWPSPANRSCWAPTPRTSGPCTSCSTTSTSRTGKGLSADVIARRLQQQFQTEIQGGLVNIFGAPPVDGLGTAGGFKIIIEDRGDNGLRDLQDAGRENRRPAADDRPPARTCSAASAPTPPGSSSTSTATRRRRWASR